MCVCVCVCVKREECEDGRVGVIEGILSNSWAALWLLIGTLSDWIVNMEHHCAFGGVYILCFIYPMLSHDQPVYYTVQSTIKMKSGSKAKKKKKAICLSPSRTNTAADRNFSVTWKLPMHGAHYHLISIQSSQLKLYRGCISLPELGAICRPLSSYLYQWRCFRGEHLGLRRQSMKWNAPGSLLCLLSKKGPRVLERHA